MRENGLAKKENCRQEKFYIDRYIEEKETGSTKKYPDFYELCRTIEEEFRKEWEESGENSGEKLELQKRAIIGYSTEVNYFRGKIREKLKMKDLVNADYPHWYDSIEDGIYQENWGLGPMAQWFGDEYRNSSSAKIIGDRIYFLEHGSMVLKEQRISHERRQQLIRAFLLLTPTERIDKNFHELYLLDGTRITIFKNDLVKEGQETLIFRRYVVPSYTFEEQAKQGTIPYEAVELFKRMVDIGFNVAFAGAVRTAKSTFLSTWQSYEDQTLEGVMIETDPELPMDKIMPKAPIVQLLADGDKLSQITKNLLRSDADYVIVAEARDGLALDTVIRIAAKGTRRMKITFHTKDPNNFPQDVAAEIVKSLGGDMKFLEMRTADSFDYIFHFIQLKDKSKKRLKSIYQMEADKINGKIIMNCICKYNYEKDNWSWNYGLTEEKESIGLEENPKAFMEFRQILQELSCQAPQRQNAE